MASSRIRAQRGGLYLAAFPLPDGASEEKIVLIVSDDGINMGLGSPIVALVTSNDRKRTSKTYVEIDPSESGLDEISCVLCHELVTLDNSDLLTRLGYLEEPAMIRVERALRIALRL